MNDVLTVADVADFLNARRVPLSSLERARRSGPFPYYGATGVIDYVDEFLFEGPHVLVGEDGTVVTPEGKPVVTLASGCFWVNNHAHVLIPKSREVADTYFLNFALRAVNIGPYLSGSVQPKLSMGNLKRVQLPWSDSDQRAQIAEVLGSLDDLIEANRKLMDDAKNLARTLPLGIHHETSERLGKLAAIVRGLSYSGAGLVDAGEGDLMVNMGSAANFGWLKRDGWKYYSGKHKPNHVAGPRDLIVVNTEQTWRNEILGWPLLVPSDVQRALFTHHTYRIVLNPEFEWMRPLVWATLFTSSARETIDSTVRGTTVANLPPDGLERVMVPTPSRERAEKALQATNELLELIWSLELENLELGATRDALLPLLMSGKVRAGELSV